MKTYNAATQALIDQKRGAKQGLVKFDFSSKGNWPYPGAHMDLDFLDRRYHWDGQDRLESDFTRFDVASFDATKGALMGAGYGITLPASSAGVDGTEFTVIYIYRVTVAAAQSKHILDINDGTNDNRVNSYVTTGNGNISVVVTESGNHQTYLAPNVIVTNERQTVGLSVQQDNVKGKSYGKTEVVDLVSNFPSGISTFEIGHVRDAIEFDGYIERIIVFDTAQSTYTDIVDKAHNKEYLGGVFGFWTGPGKTTHDSVLYRAGASLLNFDEFRQTEGHESITHTLKLRAVPVGGLTPDILAAIENYPYQDAPVWIGEAWSDIDDPYTFTQITSKFTGYISHVEHVEDKDSYVLEMSLLNKDYDAHKVGHRVRTDEDQRLLGNPNDGFYRHAALVASQRITIGGG